VNDIYVYMHNQDNDVLHLVPFDRARMPRQHWKTLCGRDASEWVPGDETITGFSATCGSCRKMVRQAINLPT
jgi:hypothetical protein